MTLTTDEVNVLLTLSHLHSKGNLYVNADVVTENCLGMPYAPKNRARVKRCLTGLVFRDHYATVAGTDELLYRVRDGVVAARFDKPRCDLCGDKDAIADARGVGGTGSWGYHCLDCFNRNDCTLGLGFGQLLVFERS